ncbi:hypothetical protein GCM10022251_04250 [Phytohabitans flavus]
MPLDPPGIELAVSVSVSIGPDERSCGAVIRVGRLLCDAGRTTIDWSVAMHLP